MSTEFFLCRSRSFFFQLSDEFVYHLQSFWSALTHSASTGWSSLQNLANIWGSTPTPDSPTSGFPSGGPQPTQQVCLLHHEVFIS